jgi:hypothetical protein
MEQFSTQYVLYITNLIIPNGYVTTEVCADGSWVTEVLLPAWHFVGRYVL